MSSPIRSALRALTACGALALVLAGCRPDAPAAPPAAPEPIDLMASLEQAAVEPNVPNMVNRIRMSVDQPRETLYMHPPSRVTFRPVRLTLESRLELSFGVNAEAWSQPGDGVEFMVYAQAPGRERVRVFAAYVDPKHEAGQRRWIDATVVLGTFAGQEVALTLETGPGPAGSDAWDWGGWSRVDLYVGRG
jgi:hypothetical protein